MSLQEAVKSKVGKMVAGSTAPILVIGGGLSAAQAAIAAHRAGAAVVLRSRRKLMTKCVQMFLSFHRVLHLPLLVFYVCFRAGSWLIRELDPSQNHKSVSTNKTVLQLKACRAIIRPFSAIALWLLVWCFCINISCHSFFLT